MSSLPPDMNEKKTGLEAFVERHRADFDAFEPRPDLWDDIELDLTAPTAIEAEEAPLRIVPLYGETAPAQAPTKTPSVEPSIPDTAAVRSARPYGVAAAVAALLLMGTWFWQHGSEATIWTRTNPTPVAQELANPSSSLPDKQTIASGLTAMPATAGPEQRLAAAVQRMESYYATQITERRQELQQLEKEEPTAALSTEWQQELAGLDSTYQQLRNELYRNPEPTVVLEAMDRNLQIRLDLLNQQLRTREQIRDYHSQPFIVADSRQTP